MTLNPVDTTKQIRAAGMEASENDPIKQDQMHTLLEVFHKVAARQAAAASYLRNRNNARLRYAIPLNEDMAVTYPCPILSQPITKIATDGSQIGPDKNSPREFVALSYGVFKVNPLKNQIIPFNQTILRTGRGLKWRGEKIDSDYLELLRDVRERSIGLAFIRNEAGCVLLFDGPVELFRVPGNTPGKRFAFQQYLAVLRRYCSRNVAIAGYVDAPQSDAVIQALELCIPLVRGNLGTNAPLFPDLDDFDLWFSLLASGERSAIFEIQSPSSRFYQGDLAIHCFYINAHTKGNSRIARVEVPRYVALSKTNIDSIHATIVADSVVTRGYPYILYRAHELAELTREDKRIIEEMLGHELRKRGLRPRPTSRKQELKNEA